MSEFPNPALRSVLARTIVPFVPVWLLGTVLALLLAQWGIVEASLAWNRVVDFLAVYSSLVVALVALVAGYQYVSTPARIAIGVDGVLGWRGAGSPGAVVDLPFSQLRTVVSRSLLGYRVEGRVRDRPSGPVHWLNLTPDNAERVAAAWLAWKSRETEPEPPFPGVASATAAGA